VGCNKRWLRRGSPRRRFLSRWGDQVEALGWTARDLFGLHTAPAQPHPSYSRLSRYDETGLCWLLDGREVVALTADTATVRNPKTSNLTVYRRHNKPALGPLGDGLEDLQ
jgi:hypothetical protein